MKTGYPVIKLIYVAHAGVSNMKIALLIQRARAFGTLKSDWETKYLIYCNIQDIKLH